MRIDTVTQLYTRISTEAATSLYETEDRDVAIASFARAAGFAELADVLGETTEEAEADLDIDTVSAADVVSPLLDRALESDAVEDGAEVPFASAEAWADWCLEGADGDAIRAFAKLHGVDASPLVEAARDELSRCDLDAINAPFAEPDEPSTYRVHDYRVHEIANDILPAVQESIIGGSELDGWTGEEAIDAYAEGSEWEEEIENPALRKAVAARLDADLARMREE